MTLPETGRRTGCHRAARAMLWFVLAAAALAPTAPGLSAQTSPSVDRRTLISMAPLLVPLGHVAGEFQRASGARFSIGGAASYTRAGAGGYSTVEVKARIYRNRVPLRGAALGVALGATRLESSNKCDPATGCQLSEKTAIYPSAAFLLDYNWLLGDARRFVISAGLGGKRIFGDGEGFTNDIFMYYPTARLQLGITL